MVDARWFAMCFSVKVFFFDLAGGVLLVRCISIVVVVTGCCSASQGLPALLREARECKCFDTVLLHVYCYKRCVKVAFSGACYRCKSVMVSAAEMVALLQLRRGDGACTFLDSHECEEGWSNGC